MSDVISRLRIGWERLEPKDVWRADCENIFTEDGKLLLSVYTERLSYTQDESLADFIAVAHNEFGRILAVLESAQAFRDVDSNECTPDSYPDDDALEVLIAALSALKGDHT